MSTAVATVVEKDLPIVSIATLDGRMAHITVVCQDTYDIATQEIKFQRGVAKQMDDERVRRRRPLDQQFDQLQADFMPVINAANANEKTLKALQKAFLIAEEKKRVEAERAVQAVADEAAAALVAKAAKLEEKGQVEQATALRALAANPTAVTVAPTVTKSAGTSLPKKWKGRITNVAAFLADVAANSDRHYLVEILQSKLDRAINETKGQMHVAGVENYEDFDIRVGK